MPTTPAPPADILRFRELGARSGGRYSAAAADAEMARAAGLAALRDRAALVGDNGSALPGAAQAFDARAGIVDTRAAGDSGAWGDWWAQTPDIHYARSQGIGAAGASLFDQARNKKMARRRTGKAVPKPYFKEWDPLRDADDASRWLDLRDRFQYDPAGKRDRSRGAI